jgi:hypothetical protein
MIASLIRSWTMEASIYPTILDTSITEYYICDFRDPVNYTNQGFAVGIYRIPADNSYLPVLYCERSMGNTGANSQASWPGKATTGPSVYVSAWVHIGLQNIILIY